MLKQKLLLLALPLTLAACNHGAPSNEEVTKIINSNLHTADGQQARVTDLRCTKHENAKYLCFVGYQILNKKGEVAKNIPTQGRENVQFLRLNKQWVARGL